VAAEINNSFAESARELSHAERPRSPSRRDYFSIFNDAEFRELGATLAYFRHGLDFYGLKVACA
jgi:hypothetical protein